MDVVSLPCDDPVSWQKLEKLFLLLAQLKKLSDIEQLVLLLQHGASFKGAPFKENVQQMLTNLHKCLSEHFTKPEQERVLCKTLPAVSQLALQLQELVPAEGIPFLRQERAGSLVVARKLVASLLANGFLCTIPSSVEHSGPGSSDINTGLNFNNFFAVFSWENKGNYHTTQLAKLRTVLSYFKRIADNTCDLKGFISISRNTVSDSNLPTIRDWTASRADLCPMHVDNDCGIEKMEEHTLHVLFADRSIGCNMLQSGRMEEELQFCQFPELLVLLLVCDEMESNESVVVKGVEQFCDCKGRGPSLEFIAEHTDQTKRDLVGTFQKLMVAMDAVPFRSKKVDNQYRQSYLLRELNKALVGFYCPELRGDAMTDSSFMIRKALESTGSSTADFSRSYSVYPEWRVDDSMDGAINESVSALADSLSKDVISSVTQTSVGRFAGGLAANVVSQAVCAAAQTGGVDRVSQLMANLVDGAIGSALQAIGGGKKVLTIGDLVDGPTHNTSSSSYANDLSSIVISNTLQSIAQKSEDGDEAAGEKASFSDQLTSKLNQISMGRSSPSKLSAKTAARPGWPDSLRFSLSSRNANSMIWSSAATVNDGSDPPSPSELASLCFDDAEMIVTGFAADMSSQIVTDAITAAVSASTISEPLRMLPVPSADDEGDGPGHLSVLNRFAPRWKDNKCNLLRPVSTGNWGAEALNGDVQLKSMLQWMAVSVTGRPLVIYHTDRNQQMQKLQAVIEHVLANVSGVGKLAEMVVFYCDLKCQQSEPSTDLYSFILSS